MNKESLFVIKPDEKSQQIAQEAVSVATKLGLMVSLIGKKVLTPEEDAHHNIELFRRVFR